MAIIPHAYFHGGPTQDSIKRWSRASVCTFSVFRITSANSLKAEVWDFPMMMMKGMEFSKS